MKKDPQTAAATLPSLLTAAFVTCALRAAQGLITEVIKAQHSWSWRLTITPYQHERVT
jgi:hypothetical protein